MTTTSTLRTQDLTVAYDRHVVVSELDFDIEAGSFTALVGPNGSGKSTILNTCARLLSPRGGTVLLDGETIHELPSRAVARRLAIMPQAPTAPHALRVSELVLYGRFPYRNLLGMTGPEDQRAMEEALELAELGDLAHRRIGELSGGERQRVFLAMALAQQTEYLLLDEPTASLDLLHQLEIIELLRRFNETQGKTLVLVLHDLNLAARYASRMVAIRDGRIVKAGTPEEVMWPEVLREVFGIEAEILRSPRCGTPICVPHLGAGQARG